MSWALEEWKEGLSTRALQKIQELEGQLDKLKKENQQRKFQLESLEAALQKQKQKVDDQKNEVATLKRENQGLMETCDNLEKMRQKISHDLQVKESQMNFQEGQLSSSKKQIEKLEQELKRCKSELERSQLTMLPGDVSTLNSTPQKSAAAPVQSSHRSASKYEELQEKYSKEVEERKRLEEEIKTLRIKKASKTVPPNTMSHREIARHQSSSSVFSWQQEKTPTRHSASIQETPLRRGLTALHISREQETTPNRMSGWQTERKDTNCSFHENQSNPYLLDQIKAQNQELRCKVNELEYQLQRQEKDIKGHVNKWQETQLKLEKTKLELMEKEKVLNKTRDELMRLTTQFDQATAKCTSLEQKLKKMSEDLSCQRQNAESTRCALEQKMKDREKDYQEELSHQQHTLQMLDQQNTQIKAKLNQELQQAQSMQNILQAELDKVVAVKQKLERNSDDFKQKLFRAEQALQTSQTKENELRRTMEEMTQEKQLFSHQLDKRTREVCQLEEELKKTKNCLKQNQNLVEEMKDKNATQEEDLKALQEKINQQEKSLTLEKLKLAVADLEKQRECSRDLLKKREHHIEQLNDKLNRTEKESEGLLSTLELKEKECEELKNQTALFSQWKNEKEQLLNQLLLEKEGLQSKINHLEICLKTQQMKNHDANESFKITEKENLGLEIRNLQDAIEGKNIELEAQKRAYNELQLKAECSDQKYKKEIENLSWKIIQVTEEVEHLKQKLQLMSSEMLGKDQRYEELCIQYEKINNLVKSKNISQMTSDDHCGDLLILDQPILNNSFTNILEIQSSLPLERGDQKIKLHLEDQSVKSAAVLQHEVSSFELSIESQKQMNSDLQKHCGELVQIKGQIEENLIKAEHMNESLVDKQFQMISELQESGQTEIEDLKINNRLLEESVKELQLMSETLSSEKEEINSVLFQNKKEIEELTQENRNLKEINAILNIEKMNLIQKNCNFSNCLIEREKNILELSDRNREEELISVKRGEGAEKGFERLQEKYKLVEEKNTELEYILSKHTASLCGNRNNELKDLEGAFAREHEDYVGRLALAEEKNEKLIHEKEAIQCELRAEIAAIQHRSKIEVDGLRQEISDFKCEKSKIQEQYHVLLQENDRLMKLGKIKDVQRNELVLTDGPASEQISEASNENGNELDNFKMVQVEMFHLNSEAKDCSLNTYNAQVLQLEEAVKHMELRLKESEQEKEVLKQELEMMRKELETRDSKVMETKQNDPSSETNNYEDCEREMDEKYISVLHELSTSQNDNAQWMTSLQTAVNKLNELEKMCEILQIEKLELTSELNDSKSECILATTKMAEKVEKLVNEVKTLNNENNDLPGDLTEENVKDQLGEQCNEPKSICLKLLEGSIEDGGDYEYLKLSNKKVQMHFVELQEKFSPLQVEHRILYEQHCSMSSKLSELRSYNDTLKAENSALSINLKNLQTDLSKQCTPGKEEFALELGESLSSSCINDIPNLSSFVESSFYKDLFEETREISTSSLEENILDNQSGANIEEAPCSSPVVDCMIKKIARSDSSLNIEELDMVCETYQMPLKNLEDKYQSQEIMKDKEIQELKQLIGSERKELESLREQYLSENEQWQQKLASVTVEMESKLAAEKTQIEYLSLQLEVARLQLQGLDLSSRSFLIAEGAIKNDQENSVSDKSEDVSFIDEKIIKSDRQHICEQNGQQTLNLHCEKIAEINGISSAVIYSRELNLENEHRNSSDKTPNNSECIHELSFSSNDTLAAMDFLENQVLIQNLQMQVKKTSDENLKLVHGIEESNKKVDRLLSEIKELDSQLGLQKTELTAKICMCAELEKVIQELQKEKSDLSEKLESLSYDNQQLLQRVTSLENLSSGSRRCKAIFTDTTDTGDNIAMVNKDCKGFLEIENELKRVRSEENNIENHAFSIEADLEGLQTKNLCLEKDNDNKQKMLSNLKEQLSLVISEKNHLSGELDILLRGKKKIEEICEKLKEKIEVLEANQRQSLQHIETMESEVREKTSLLQTMSSDVNQLLKDRDHLQEQLQSLEKDAQMLSLVKDGLKNEIGQLTNEKELLIRESENLKAKLNESEAENVSLSKVLESSLIEKGEIAARLNSTQEEVYQLRSGIEKLKIRIEADEKKKNYVTEKLKESKRNTDAFKDKIEALERELQMSEENQEAVILDAETAKSELETLKTQMEELTKGLKCSELELFSLRSEKNRLNGLPENQGQQSELEGLAQTIKCLETEIIALRTEKENILKELPEKQGQVSQLEPLAQSLKFIETEVFCVRSEKENTMKDIQGNKGQVFELEKLTQTLNCLKSELVALRSEKEIILKELQEKENRVSELEEVTQSLKCLENEVTSLRSEKEYISEELHKKQSQVSELEELTETLRCIETEVVSLQSEKDNVLKELQESQDQVYELKELIESLKCLEIEVVAVKSEKEHILKDLKGKEDQVCQLEESIKTLKCLETEVVFLRSEKENTLRELQENHYQISELGELVQMLKCLDSELTTIRLEKENVLKNLQERQDRVSELEELIISLKCLETEVVSLRSEKENMSKELQEKQSPVSELEGLTINLKYLETEVASLKSEKDDMLKELQEKKDRICELEKITISLKCLETELVSLKSEKENTSKELQEKQIQVSELEELTKSLKCLEPEVAALRLEKETILKDLQEKQDQICEFEEVNISLKCLETEVVSLRLAKESMSKELEEKQNQVSELEQLTKSLKCLESEVASLTSEKENLLRQLCELEELTKNLKCLENEVVSLSSEKDHILKELQEKQGQVSDLEELTKSLKSLEPEVASLRSEKENMLKELQEKKDLICQLEEVTINLKCLEPEITALRSEKESMLKQLQEKQGRISELEETNKNLKCLETEIISLSSEKENILKELQEKQGQVAELKMLNVSFVSLLEEKEEEKRKSKEESNHTIELLKKQLNDLNEKIESLHEEHNICKVNEQDLNCQVDCLKTEKIHLLQQLEENKNSNAVLKSSMNDLIQETESDKQKLEKAMEENRILQKQVEDLRKLSSMLTQMEAEHQLLKKEKSQLENLTSELQQKIQELSKNETLFDSLEALQSSYAKLENELELTKRENSSLLEKIQLDELILEKCELKKSLDCVQKELKEQEEKARNEISDYQCRLQDANKKYETLLKEANKKHEMEIEAYQEKLICKEQDLSSHKSEMEILKSNKEELTNSLKSTSKILEELKKTKVDNMNYVTQLKKENDNAKGKIQLLIKTCKQLENEKETLQKEMIDLEALKANQKQNNAPDANVEELMAEVKELKETIEEKNKETDEYLDKYCSLLVSYEKLEKTKDMLEAQVTFLNSLQGKLTSQTSPLLNSVDSKNSPSHPVTDKKTLASQSKVSSKRRRSCGAKQSDGESMSSTPEILTKRIKKGATPKDVTGLSRGLENTEYEPEGLPEVVKKGFADIPTGKTSPYVLRRTTLASRASSRLAAQKLSPSSLNLLKEQSESLAETSKPTAGGSKSQKAKDVHQHQVESLVTVPEPTTRSSLSANNLSKKTSADIPKESMRTRQIRHSLRKQALTKQSEENCKVQ
ncbi:centromere protein F isoform X2 [Petaurus breviceps papuanus]|uniref:centromere protein F isoform X2 n=1 Tax=Petaurus breviceps papuanus TaxID=3040969 RepID=UPI0036D9250B